MGGLLDPRAPQLVTYIGVESNNVCCFPAEQPPRPFCNATTGALCIACCSTPKGAFGSPDGTWQVYDATPCVYVKIWGHTTTQSMQKQRIVPCLAKGYHIPHALPAWGGKQAHKFGTHHALPWRVGAYTSARPDVQLSGMFG